jgi:phosphoadenosine phosphosulfate reductase
VAGKIVFTTSFELEDQVTIHLLSQQESGIEVFTLDTGRPFPETYALWAETERRDGLRVRALYSKFPIHGRNSAQGDQHADAAGADCNMRSVPVVRAAIAVAA